MVITQKAYRAVLRADLSGSALRTLLWISTKIDSGCVYSPGLSADENAADCGYSRRTFSRALKELATKEFIEDWGQARGFRFVLNPHLFYGDGKYKHDQHVYAKLDWDRLHNVPGAEEKFHAMINESVDRGMRRQLSER